MSVGGRDRVKTTRLISNNQASSRVVPDGPSSGRTPDDVRCPRYLRPLCDGLVVTVWPAVGRCSYVHRQFSFRQSSPTFYQQLNIRGCSVRSLPIYAVENVYFDRLADKFRAS